LTALHKDEAHKQAERDIDDAMKYLNSGGADDDDDTLSSLVPDRLEPEEAKRIAKERLREMKEAAGEKTKDTKKEEDTSEA